MNISMIITLSYVSRSSPKRETPLLLNKKLANRVVKDIDINYRGRVQIDAQLLAKKKAEFLALIPNSDSELESAFDKVFVPTNKEQSVAFADPYKIEKQFDALPKAELAKLLQELSENRLALIEVKKELLLLESQKEDELKDAQKDRVLEKELLKKIGHQEAVCEALEEKLNNFIQEYKTLESEYAKLTIVEHKQELTQKKIDTLQAVINVAKEMKKKIKKDKRASLEKTINEKFMQLKKEGYEAESIRLDEKLDMSKPIDFSGGKVYAWDVITGKGKNDLQGEQADYHDLFALIVANSAGKTIEDEKEFEKLLEYHCERGFSILASSWKDNSDVFKWLGEEF